MSVELFTAALDLFKQDTMSSVQPAGCPTLFHNLSSGHRGVLFFLLFVITVINVLRA